MPPLRGAPYRERTLFIPTGGEAEGEGGVGGERVERKEGRTSEPEARFRTASSLSPCCSVTVVPSFLLFLLSSFFSREDHRSEKRSFFRLIFNPLRSNDDSHTPFGSMRQLDNICLIFLVAS